MVATKPLNNTPLVRESTTLQALTAAALLLPGLAAQQPVYAADGDEFSFQYGRYEEGKRDLGGIKSTLQPIEVDSLQSSGRVSLADRVKFAFNFIQDTWSGATPITTAPSSRGGNRPYTQFNTVAGASPLLKDIDGGAIYFDQNRRPLNSFLDGDLGERVSLGVDDRVVHTMSVASPETRKEGNFKLSHEWDEMAIDVGGGISVESDYESRFGNLGARFDFNQKLTTLAIGGSYANSENFSRLSPHFTKSYINSSAFANQIRTLNDGTGDSVILGDREDWSGNINLTQVVNKSALFKLGTGFTHSTGYLENPYKAVTAFFIADVNAIAEGSVTDPDSGFPVTIGDFSSTIPYVGVARAFLEQRPNNRNQFNLTTGWVQHIAPLDAALHFDYRFNHDDWGINAHTFEGDWVQPVGSGWTITPRVRYYSQSQADFYYQYLIADMGSTVSTGAIDPGDNAKLPTQTFSSDHRLSGFGALSGGVMIGKQFARGLRFDAGFEYYTHRGSLRMDGVGEGDYADFDYWVANGSMTVNLSTLGRTLAESGHAHHALHHGAPLPAGIFCNGHMLEKADDFMMGYIYMYGRQDGAILQGSRPVNDATIIANGCEGGSCRTVPTFMNMYMHMLDIMYAPTDWFNLMLMPQFMDMDMNLRQLSGVVPDTKTYDHLHGGHTTGGIGDTLMYGMFKLFDDGQHHVNVGMGFSAPTADVDIKLNRMHGVDGGFIHYGMQLGSGTWDFKPTLTYSGRYDDWSWGAQINGTTRMQNHNQSGFAFGDMVQSSAWGGYNLLKWLSGSVRGVYTTQGAIRGRFNPIPGDCIAADQQTKLSCADTNPQGGTMDHPQNYGGRFWDVGLGLNAMIPDGAFVGHHMSVEWLQPVMDDVNGYQLERSGSLTATWSYMF